MAAAINLNHFLTIFLEPGVLQNIGRTTNDGDFPAHAEYRSVFDNSEFLEFAPSTWAGIARFRPQRN